MIKPEKTTCAKDAHELIQGEIGYLQEQIVWLAKDIINIDQEQSQMFDNVNRLIDVLDKSADVHRNTVETLSIHQREITNLSNELEKTDRVWWRVLAILIWLLILTWWVVYNVFF